LRTESVSESAAHRDQLKTALGKTEFDRQGWANERDSVFFPHLRHFGGVQSLVTHHGNVVELLIEARRRHHVAHPDRRIFIAHVCEGVRHARRDGGKVARFEIEQFVFNLYREHPVEDEERVVLFVVNMKRRSDQIGNFANQEIEPAVVEGAMLENLCL